MKIKKKSSVKASDFVDKPLISQDTDPLVEAGLTECCDCKYQSAIDLIKAAIESLAEIAKDDTLAKDSIANLGVVMLDLKGDN